MKVKVIKIFRDKYTNEVYLLNQEIEVTEERFKEINERTENVEIIKEKQIKDKKQNVKK